MQMSQKYNCKVGLTELVNFSHYHVKKYPLKIVFQLN